MWILSIIPEALIHTIFILSILGIIAGFVLGFIPLVKTYQYPIRVCSIVLLVISVYLEGALADKKAWDLKIKDMEAKVAKAEAESVNKNSEIQVKVVEKTKVIREKGKDILIYIDTELAKKEEIIKYVEKCPIPKDIIDIHNKATDLNKGNKK